MHGGVVLLGVNLLSMLRALHIMQIWTFPGCGFAPPRLRRTEPAYDRLAQKALPRGLTTAVEERSADWDAKVEELAHRGFEVGALLEFFAKLPTLMPHFDANLSTTNDVVRSCIIPASAGSSLGDCALATVINGGERVLPQMMVSHHWANIFTHTIAAVVADAFDVSTYAEIAGVLARGEALALKARLEELGRAKRTYWLCAVSVNQHCSICGGFAPGKPPERDTVSGKVFELCTCTTAKHFSGDPCEMNKFDDMMSYLCGNVEGFGQVVAIDVRLELFSRAWVIAELVQARKSGMVQKLKLHSKRALAKHSTVAANIDIRKCQASRVEDNEYILSKVDDIDLFNKELREMLLNSETGLFAEWMAGEDTSTTTCAVVCELLASMTFSVAR
jgi:hypothetical protein